MSTTTPFHLFVPSRCEGLNQVSAVCVYPDRLVVTSAGQDLVYSFRKHAKRQGLLFFTLLRRILGMEPRSRIVGERDWFHAPADRHFRWYVAPPLTTYMPRDDPEDYEPSTFLKIRKVLQSGGFATVDLG